MVWRGEFVVIVMESWIEQLRLTWKAAREALPVAQGYSAYKLEMLLHSPSSSSWAVSTHRLHAIVQEVLGPDVFPGQAALKELRQCSDIAQSTGCICTDTLNQLFATQWNVVPTALDLEHDPGPSFEDYSNSMMLELESSNFPLSTESADPTAYGDMEPVAVEQAPGTLSLDNLTQTVAGEKWQVSEPEPATEAGEKWQMSEAEIAAEAGEKRQMSEPEPEPEPAEDLPLTQPPYITTHTFPWEGAIDDVDLEQQHGSPGHSTDDEPIKVPVTGDSCPGPIHSPVGDSFPVVADGKLGDSQSTAHSDSSDSWSTACSQFSGSWFQLDDGSPCSWSTADGEPSDSWSVSQDSEASGLLSSCSRQDSESSVEIDSETYVSCESCVDSESSDSQSGSDDTEHSFL